MLGNALAGSPRGLPVAVPVPADGNFSPVLNLDGI